MSTIRLAMTGTRGHHGIVLRELPSLPAVQLVAAAVGGDTVEPILEAFGRRGAPPPQAFDEHAAMLDAVKPDAVVVCGPFERHADMCVDAITRGVHVYTEKPAALSLAELERLRAAANAHRDVRVVGMMQGRYAPGFHTAWRLIRDGAIGEVRLIDARKSYKLGRRPPYYHARDTYGGTIPWVGSHAIDWVYWMCGGADERVAFESVTAHHHTDPLARVGTMERSAACLFSIAGGRVATVSIDVYRPESAPTHGDDWVRVVGTGGVIEARPDSVEMISGTSGGQVSPSCDRTPFADFIADMSGGPPGLITTRDTLDVTEACLLARQSADERRTVDFPRHASG